MNFHAKCDGIFGANVGVVFKSYFWLCRSIAKYIYFRYSRQAKQRSMSASQSDCNCDRHSIQNSFLRIRTTIFFIGIILLIFGIALLLTFNGHTEDNKRIQNASVLNCDEFISSMRLTGILLIALAFFTIIISLSLIIIYNKSKRIFSSQSAISANGEISEHSRSRIQCFFNKLLQNWRRQNSVITAEEFHLRINRELSSQDQPPEYTSLPGIGSSNIELPPPYSESV